MQSESTEYSPYSPTTSVDKSQPVSQHGFHGPAPGNQLALEDDLFQGQPRGAVEPERLSAIANAERRQQDAPVKAIIEHENAFLPATPKQDDDDGPVFKVVPSRPGRKTGQQLDQFPNGRHTQAQWEQRAGLTRYRGLDAYFIPPAGDFTLCCVARI